MTRILTILSILLFSTVAYSQELKGVVFDENNIPLPGANIVTTPSNANAVTDFDGNFSLKVAAGDKIKVSYIGYKTQELDPVFPSMTIVMQPESNVLDEVVIVGYGSQKKADLTGAISAISSDVISKTPSGNVTSSLQGKVAGVIVTNTGAPGNGADVKLRGVSSYTTNNNPLYVVDGMYYDNIDFLDPNSIKEISVLKDASSTAIFGVKGAGGVIIIETKSGKNNNIQEFSYNGYTGIQVPQDVLIMANAEQFVRMAYESGSQADIDAVLEAMQRYGRSRVNPNVPNVNTDWYKETLTRAPITNHNINFSGGSENTTYSFGANYFNQAGILKVADNKYERLNFLAKVDTKFNDRFKGGANMLFSNATQYYAENSAWNQIYFAVPVLPVYDPNNTIASPVNYANAKDIGYREYQNPFVALDFINDRYKKRSINSNFYLDYSIIKDLLSVKTNYNLSYRPENHRKVELPYILGNTLERDRTNIKVEEKLWFDQIWDNTLNFQKSLGNHNFNLLGGTSFRVESFNELWGFGYKPGYNVDPNGWYLNNTLEDERQTGNGAHKYYAISYFGRLQYSYADKYLLNASYRAEGNSKYTKKPWGYFPGVGLGWVVSNEKFFEKVNFIDFLKFRAAWGKNGNDKVGASTGANVVNQVVTSLNGVDYSAITVTSTYADLEWELIEESNFGLSSRFLNNQLSLEMDYYVRNTDNAIIPVYQPIVGVWINDNVGVFKNSGLETALTWNKTVNDNFKYNIGVNFSTLKNEVVELFKQEYLDSGQAEFRQRSIPGDPIKAFYGWETAGVYQNMDEINADPIAVTNNLEPGDFKYVDQNKDGVIDGDDRVVLGSFLPSLTYGANLGMNYKKWDFSMNLYGQSGNKILNKKRGQIIWTNDQNMDRDLAVNRWHGEGTTNEYPSSKGLRKAWNQKMSNFFVEDGSYFRIQNIQLGYKLDNLKFLGDTEGRIYLTAERPLSFFKYNGFNPEVSDGIDYQQYPVSSVYTIGFNFNF